jgi:glycosyltransferase involved in cell wall biosynthesis
MKILHIAESAQGGVGTYLAEILPEQVRALGDGNVRALVPDAHAAHVTGVDRRLIATWKRGGRSVGTVLTLIRAIRREIAAFAPDVVHAHSSLAGGLVRLLYGWGYPSFRIVYCPHGWAFDRRALPFKNRLLEQIERNLEHAADRIVVISAHERDAALRIGISPERLSLILNGISDQPVRHPARWDDDRVKVLFVGRLDEQKGYDTLVDAVEPLQDRVSLRVIGKAIAGPGTTLRGSRAQIEYLGWRSLSEIATEIAAADVVVVPSRWEGFGLVALEAMRGGCAVVASAVGGLPEIVVDRVTGRLVPPDSPERLMRTLADHDKAEWHAMGQAGRARFEALFTAEPMNRELLAMYRDVLSERPPALKAGRPVHA